VQALPARSLAEPTRMPPCLEPVVPDDVAPVRPCSGPDPDRAGFRKRGTGSGEFPGGLRTSSDDAPPVPAGDQGSSFPGSTPRLPGDPALPDDRPPVLRDVDTRGDRQPGWRPGAEDAPFRPGWATCPSRPVATDPPHHRGKPIGKPVGGPHPRAPPREQNPASTSLRSKTPAGPNSLKSELGFRAAPISQEPTDPPRHGHGERRGPGAC